VDLDGLEATQEPCWLGVDLSPSNSDLTCIVAAWKDGQDGYLICTDHSDGCITLNLPSPVHFDDTDCPDLFTTTAMPRLPNPRHETFAQALAKDMNATEAYATAGYKGDRTAISRLSTNLNVAQRVAYGLAFE